MSKWKSYVMLTADYKQPWPDRKDIPALRGRSTAIYHLTLYPTLP